MKPSPRWLPWLMLAALPVILHLPFLRQPFVYDDYSSIVENPFLKDASHLGRVLALRTLGDPAVLDGQRPVVILSYFLDQAIWGLSPAGFRVTNLLLHAASVLLLFRLALRLLPRKPALACAALYALHPALLEVVHLPAYREDLLCQVFGLAGLAAGPGLLSAGAFILAALSKESGLLFPALMVLSWLLFPEQRPAPRRMAAWLAAVAGACALILFLGFAHRPLQAVGSAWNGYALQPPDHVLTLPWLWLRYGKLVLSPWPLCIDWVIQPVTSTMELRFMLGLAALLLTGLLALALVRRHRTAAFGLLWALAAFIPVSNLVPLFNPFAERYVALMLPGFLLFALALVPPDSGRNFRFALVLVLMSYAGLGLLRLRDFRNDRALWSVTLHVEPCSARALVWLALDAKHAGRLEDARTLLERAEGINPQEISSTVNLAILDGQAGNLAAAEARLREAVRRRPDRADAKANLAVALRLQGKDAEAAELESADRLGG